MTAGPLPAAPLGRGGLRVTRLMFGGAPIGGLYAPVGEDAARATLEAAWRSEERRVGKVSNCV